MTVEIQCQEIIEPCIYFTDNAVKHFTTYLDKQTTYKGLRLSLKKSGCSGLSYVVDYIEAPDSSDLKLPLTNNYSVWIEPKSYPFLKNMQVDYVRQGLNYKLIFSNPNQTGECGCGESFTTE